ncbi:hypothetical protein ALC56_08523 [Trachymyrmex septentrionalis]|uniref:Uncharacterized protein n=1 Tax=Trachymyrmex septentrionalis TaxID=34720 RepID=A0A195F947_9HYME|nr:hypothetical protein ALC56_08523 [Trachymyrmex septentrionalis]
MATALSTTGAELIGFQSQLCRVSHQPTPFRTATLLTPRNTPGAYDIQRIAANCEGPEFPVAD